MAEERFARSLKDSYPEGVAAQVTGSVVDHFVVPMAVQLGAAAPMIGWIVALPSLLSALSQFFVVDVMRALANRRRLLIIGAALQGLLLLPVAVLPLLPKGGRVWALLAALCAFKIVGGFMAPAWGSLMSEYLPANERGRYFGDRSRLLGLTGILLLALCGAGLRLTGAAAGLAAVFAAGALARLLSVVWMRSLVSLPEPPDSGFLSARTELAALINRLRGSNFARFAAYTAAVTFAAQLASSYYAVHLLRDLKFGYMEYAAIRLAAALGGFLAFPLWGRHSDHVGTARVLKLNSWLVALVPLPWIFFDRAGPLFVAELFSGAVWAGFNLCSANYVYDAVPAHRRVRALGYLNVLNGAAIFLGAALGGALAERLPPLLGSPMHALFAVSAALRLGADLLLGSGFTEVRRDAAPASSMELFFSVVGVRPLIGRNESLGRRSAIPT